MRLTKGVDALVLDESIAWATSTSTERFLLRRRIEDEGFLLPERPGPIDVFLLLLWRNFLLSFPKTFPFDCARSSASGVEPGVGVVHGGVGSGPGVGEVEVALAVDRQHVEVGVRAPPGRR